MKPLLILAIAAVAAGAMGTGFLNNSNGINLWIQQFGVGEGDIETPVTHVKVDFNIVRTSGDPPGTYDNVIDRCDLMLNDNLGAGAVIFCKLTDWEGDIIAEGSTTLANGYLTPAVVGVPITAGDNNIVNVKDVIIVVQGGDGDETFAEATTIAP